MIALLIDGCGREWPAKRDTIEHRFGPMRGSQTLPVEAVSLGFIVLDVCAAGARVALLPEFATRRAISRLAMILSGAGIERVLLSKDGLLQRWDLIRGAGRAICEIDRLVSAARNPPPRTLFASQPLSLDRCAEINGGRLKPVLQVWYDRRGQWEADFYERLLEWGLMPITLVTHQLRNSERLVVESWGNRLKSFGKTWPNIASGRDTEDRPNEQVGRLFGSLVRQMIANKEPEFMKVDHVFRANRGKLLRSTYSRLAMPWHLPDKSVRVTEITTGRRTITLEDPNARV